MAMSQRDRESIKELADILDAKGLTEIEYERGGLRVRVARAGAGAGPAPSLPPAPVDSTPATAEDDSSLGSIVSPMVGTFYAAPSPEASPFVRVGDRVSKGQSVCIIEAMKLMNEIESDLDGALVERLVENGQAVEFGQVLFKVAVD